MFPRIEALLSADVAGNAIPSQHGSFVPELSDLALVGSSRDAVDISDRFHFVVVPRVRITGQVKVLRNIGTELSSIPETKWRHGAPSRKERWYEGGRSWFPYSGSRRRRPRKLRRCRT